MALEGKEIEGKIGEVGSYSLDIDDRGNVAVMAGGEKKITDYLAVKGSLSLNLDIVGGLLHASAKAPGNQFLKTLAEGVARFAGRLPPAAPQA